MVYHSNALATTEMLREILHETDADFPYIAIESDLEHFTDHCSSWHWHDYFEFAIVVSGSMELHTQQRTYHISEGEGYFINSNILHLCRVADDSKQARLHVHQFDRSLLTSSSAVMRRYILPMENCQALSELKLSADDPAHMRLLDLIREAFAAAESEPEGFEVTISACLIRAWQTLFSISSQSLENASAVSSMASSRIKEMLAYVHTHYAEDITAPMIASAANVCTREVFRCFRKVLGTTPNAYLVRHRINCAARMLFETNLSITDISIACGFSTPSYFCKVFSGLIGHSPRDFRRNAGGANAGK